MNCCLLRLCAEADARSLVPTQTLASLGFLVEFLPVQVLDLVARLGIPCGIVVGRVAASALFHRTGLVLGSLGAALRPVRWLRDGCWPCWTLGSAFRRRAHTLHIFTI